MCFTTHKKQFSSETEEKLTMVSEGDSNHHHSFHEVPWDRQRFGSDVTDFDDRNQPFPRATYKYLFQCSCGAEVIKSSRGLL